MAPLSYPAAIVPRVLTLTLDTSCVIHAAQGQSLGYLVERLVALAQQGRIRLFLTTAYIRDQERATTAHRDANLAWLERSEVLSFEPGPFRLGYSRLGGPDLLAEGMSGPDDAARRIVLPRRLWAEVMTGEAVLSESDVRKFHDVQHLVAHCLAGHDAFVTGDEDDILDKRDRLLREAGVTVWTLGEAVVRAQTSGNEPLDARGEG